MPQTQLIECCLAIETSGHAALKENYFLDDGAYLVSRILIKMARMQIEGRYISQLIADLKHPEESMEFRLPIVTGDFGKYGSSVIDEIRKLASAEKGWHVEAKNYEGVRVNCMGENGWFLLRLSLHDPLLELNIEAERRGGIKNIKDQLTEMLRGFDQVNIASLQ